MVSDAARDEGSLPSPNQNPQSDKRCRWRRNDEDVQRWATLFKGGLTIVHIAERESVDPGTVSQQLHSLGLTVTQGHHMVQQLPLKYSPQFVELVDKGPDAVLGFVRNRVWGIQASSSGENQLRNFCEFVRLHHLGVGVKEMSRVLSVHRSTISHWRDATDQPYLIRALNDTLPLVPRTEWRVMPMHLVSGGAEPSGWIQVPEAIRSYGDVLDVINQIQPLEETYRRASPFGLTKTQVQAMRPELFAYQLGIMVGDAGKLGGLQPRYSSMNLDLQLTQKQPTNERLGEFVMMCANSFGIQMERKRDKQPSGATAMGEHPSAAFRWTSERSPLLAWMFSVGLGLSWGETTTTHQLRMDWILDTPRLFRVRFVQGAADSDGCVKHTVEIASVPNSQFFANVLQSLGITSAHCGYEKGEPLRTVLSLKQAASLPIFNEFVKSYRYQKLMNRT